MAVKFSQFSNTSPTATTYLVGFDGTTNVKISYSSLLSGTSNYVTKWGTPSGLANSLIYDNGTSVGIGTASPDASSLLSLSSTSKGLLIPRMTGAQVEAISSPGQGLLAYSTDTSGTTVNQQGLWQYNAGSWQNTALKNDVRKQIWKPVNTVEYFEDFIAVTTTGNFAGWTGWVSGTGSNANNGNYNNRDSNDFGLNGCGTGTTTTGRGAATVGFPQSGAYGIGKSGNTRYFELQLIRANVSALSDATNEYVAEFGLLYTINVNAINSGSIYFVYNRALYGDFWVLRVNGATPQIIVTTTPVTTAVTTLKITVDNFYLASTNGATVRGYINGTEIVASSGTYPVTTNVPTGNFFAPGFGIFKSAGTTARSVVIDAAYCYIENNQNRFTL
jgi:hypothetical protein